jgi:hypothetical protein
MSFLLAQQLPAKFRPVALYKFLKTMMYADWVNENVREIKYFEE